MRGKKLLVSIVAVLVCIGAGLLAYRHVFRFWNDPIYIALAGPMSGNNAPEGASYLNGFRLYFDQINARGGINGAKVIIDVKDDHNDPQHAAKMAREIVAEHRALAVIGHQYSSCSISAGQIYKTARIPAITPVSTNVAVTRDNPWYFRTIFNDHLQGRFLINYAAQVLGHKTISVIHEDGAQGKYGAGIAATFIETAGDLENVRIAHRWRYVTGTQALDARFDQIVGELGAVRDSAGLLFLSMKAPEAVRLIKLMRDQGITNPIMGPDAFTSGTMQKAFLNEAREKHNPGFYTKGIYTTSPLIYDFTNEQTQQFYHTYTRKYGDAPSWRAAYAYDAAILIHESILNADISGAPEKLADDRVKIRDALARILCPDYVVEGATGPICFNADGDSPKQIAIGVYHRNKVVSAFTQLQKVIDPTALAPPVADTAAVNRDRILRFGRDDLYYLTDVVYTGAKVHEISDIDIHDLTCSLDFSLWFRHKGNLDLKAIEFLNALEPIDLGAPVVEELRNGIRYSRFRIKGKFKADFVDQRYALDQHVFGFSLRHRTLRRHSLIFVNDDLGMQAAGSESIFFNRPTSGWVLNPLSGWRIDQTNAFQDSYRAGDMGSSAHLEHINPATFQFSRYNLEIKVLKEGFPIRRFLNGDVLNVLLLAGLLLAVGLTCGVHVNRVPYTKTIGVFQIVGIYLFLLTAEIALTNVLAHWTDYSLAEAIMQVFSMLWWLAGAYFLSMVTSRLIYQPLEIKTGHKVPKLVYHSTVFTIFLFACFGIVAFVFGKTITSLLATSGVFAAIIGLAVQINISNVFSGIAINLERPFRIGDWVKIGAFDEGVVENITWRSTHLRTRDNNIVCIPNSVAAESPIQNFNFPDKCFVLTFPIYVGIEHPRTQVQRIILEALHSLDWILTEPAPTASFRPSDWAVAYCPEFHAVDYQNKPDYEDEAVAAIWSRLKAAGIEPAVRRFAPARELETGTGDVN